MAENVRKKNYNNRKEVRQKAPDVCAGTVEYKMSRQMAEQLIGVIKTLSKFCVIM